MRYLSLFSGIEAASVAWEPLGWECVAVAEVDAFASAVLAHRYPSVPNLGDVTKIDAADLAALGRIDLVVFGSPCQDLSVAGKREGLAGERSGLFHTAVDIVRWAREYCGCRWALWENVCGAFSSNKGRDFAAVVGELAGVDVPVPPKGWGTEGAAVGDEGMVEWAVLDAQWFGVAQRRRRVFALADFGDWASRPPVLLEPQGLRGDSPPRRGQGAAVAVLTAPGAGTCGADDNQAKAGHLIAFDTRMEVRTFDFQSSGQGGGAPVAPTMSARDFKSAKDLVAYAIAMRGREGGAFPEMGGDVSNALRSAEGGGSRDYVVTAVGFNWQNGGGYGNANDGLGITEEGTGPLQRSQHPAVAAITTGEVFHTLRGEGFDASEDGTGRGTPLVAEPVKDTLQVRRLTPTECERLQGFPDGYTAIPWRKKPADQCPDGPRYKALGNSMAVPVMAWIGRQIDIAESGLA